MAKQKKESTHNVEFAKGGDQHMFPQQAADKMKPGTTRDQTAKDDLGQKFAEGGSTKMFGFRPSNVAQAGKTSPE